MFLISPRVMTWGTHQRPTDTDSAWNKLAPKQLVPHVACIQRTLYVGMHVPLAQNVWTLTAAVCSMYELNSMSPCTEMFVIPVGPASQQ